MIVARTPCKKHEHDDQDEHERLEQRVLDFFDVLSYVFGRVVVDLILEAGRETLRQVIHALPDLADDVEPVGIGVLIDRQRPGRLAVDPSGGVIILRVKLDSGDVAAGGRTSRRRAGDDDVLELLDGRQPPLGEDRILPERLTRRDRLCADLAGGRLAVLGLDSRDHLFGRDLLVRHVVRVQPDPHRVLPPENRDVAHPADPLQAVERRRSARSCRGRSSRTCHRAKPG